jgi:hypothetical protein
MRPSSLRNQGGKLPVRSNPPKDGGNPNQPRIRVFEAAIYKMERPPVTAMVAPET